MEDPQTGRPPAPPQTCFLCQLAIGLYAEDLLRLPGEATRASRPADLIYNHQGHAVLVPRIPATAPTPRWDHPQASASRRKSATTARAEARTSSAERASKVARPSERFPQLAAQLAEKQTTPTSEVCWACPLPDLATLTGLLDTLPDTRPFTPTPTQTPQRHPAINQLTALNTPNQVTTHDWEKLLFRHNQWDGQLVQQWGSPHFRVERIHHYLLLISHHNTGTVTVVRLSGVPENIA